MAPSGPVLFRTVPRPPLAALAPTWADRIGPSGRRQMNLVADGAVGFEDGGDAEELAEVVGGVIESKK